jgi:hypothetical protein
MGRRYLLVVAFVVACSSKETPSPSASGASGASGASAPAPGPSRAKPTSGGQAPAWVPLYPGATPPAGFMKVGDGWSFHQETSDAPEAIFAFYDKALADAGFAVEVIKTPNTPKMPGLIQATAAEMSRKVSITISQTGDRGTRGVTKILFTTVGE